MTAIFFFMSFEVSNVAPLLNDFIRSREHVRWNGQADLLCCFKINDQLKIGWLSTGKSCGFEPLRIWSTYQAAR